MATNLIDRKSAKLDELITSHRVVRVEYFAGEYLTCTARKDLPEYGVKQGEVFHLYRSEYEGYFYLVRWDAFWHRHSCTCWGNVRWHHCKHADAVNLLCIAKAHARKATPTRQVENWGDEPVHVADSFRAGQQGVRAQVAFVAREKRIVGNGLKWEVTPSGVRVPMA